MVAQSSGPGDIECVMRFVSNTTPSVETSPAGPTSGPLSSSSPKPVTYAGMHSGQSKETRHNQVRSYREVVKGGIHPETSRKK